MMELLAVDYFCKKNPPKMSESFLYMLLTSLYERTFEGCNNSWISHPTNVLLQTIIDTKLEGKQYLDRE